MTRRGLLSVVWGTAARAVCPSRELSAISRPPGASAAVPLQGWAPSPLGLAISPDGQTAWVSFCLDDALLEVDLTVPAVRRAIDVSPAGVMLGSGKLVLSPEGGRLFAVNHSTGNILVVDTHTAVVERVLAIAPGVRDCMEISADGSHLFVATADGALAMVDLSDFSVRRFVTPGNDCCVVVTSRRNPRQVYCLGGDYQPNLHRSAIWLFDLESGAIIRKAILEDAVWKTGLPTSRFRLSSSEDIGWIGWCFYGSDDRGSGNLSVIDLADFRVLARTAMDLGATDIAIDEKARKIYVSGFWAGGGAPNTVPILEWDMTTRTVTRRFPISPSVHQRAIALHPDGGSAYMCDGDANYLARLDLKTGAITERLKFNRARIRPYSFIPAGADAYVACHGSPTVYRLRLATGEIEAAFTAPGGGSIAGGCQFEGRICFVAGQTAYAIDPGSGAEILRRGLARQIATSGPVVAGQKLVFLNGPPSGAQLVILDGRTLELERSIDLPADVYPDFPVVSPDGSKIYLSRGYCHGQARLMIFATSDGRLLKSIDVQLLGTALGATSFLDGDFDEVRRVLYLTGFASVWRIHMDSGELLGTALTGEIFSVLKREHGWTPTGLCGARLSPEGDRLLVVSGDGHSLQVYDTTGQVWLPVFVNLRGYWLTDVVQSPDRRYLYTANQMSDTITMVDTNTLEVVKVIGPLTGSATQIRNADVVNAASLLKPQGRLWPVAPGERIVITGTDIGPARATHSTSGEPGRLPSTLGGTQVFVEDIAAPVVSAFTDSVTAIVPYAVAGKTRARLRLTVNSESTNEVLLDVAQSAPGLFTTDGSGTGQAAAWNQDGSENSARNPAPRGSVVSLFGTGEGQTVPAGMDGKPASDPLPKSVLPVSITIGGINATVSYAGAAPGLVGVFQINAIVPDDIVPGNAVPVAVSIGSGNSQPGVTLAVR